MTRYFAFKLVYLELVLMLCNCIGISYVTAKFSDNSYQFGITAILVFPIGFALYRLLCGQEKFMLYFQQMNEICPALAKFERVHFYTYSAFLIAAITLTLKWSYTTCVLPISLELASHQQFELAERIHTLDYNFSGNIRDRAVTSIALTGNWIQGIPDVNSARRAISTVYGAESQQTADFERSLAVSLFHNKQYSEVEVCIARSVNLYNKLNLKTEAIATLATQAFYLAKRGDKANARALEMKLLTKINQLPLCKDKVNLLADLADVANLLGQSELEKSLLHTSKSFAKEVEKKHLKSNSLESEEPYFMLVGIFGGLGLSALTFNFIAFQYFCWKSRRVLRYSRQIEEQVHALLFLIPAALSMNRKLVAQEYSIKLVELSEMSLNISSDSGQA